MKSFTTLAAAATLYATLSVGTPWAADILVTPAAAFKKESIALFLCSTCIPRPPVHAQTLFARTARDGDILIAPGAAFKKESIALFPCPTRIPRPPIRQLRIWEMGVLWS